MQALILLTNMSSMLLIEYTSMCKEQLIDLDTMDSLNCDARLDYDPEYTGRCSYVGDPPAVQVTASPKTGEYNNNSNNNDK